MISRGLAVKLSLKMTSSTLSVVTRSMLGCNCDFVIPVPVLSGSSQNASFCSVYRFQFGSVFISIYKPDSSRRSLWNPVSVSKPNFNLWFDFWVHYWTKNVSSMQKSYLADKCFSTEVSSWDRLANSGFGHSGTPSPPIPSLPSPPSFSPPLPPSRSAWAPP